MPLLFSLSLLVLYSGYWTLWMVDPLLKEEAMDQHNQRRKSSTIDPRFACNADLILNNGVKATWKSIDDKVARFPKAPVSGGIFLYPRQASLLTSLIQSMTFSLHRPVTLCETGFGSGHSLALFAHASAAAKLHILSFDKFDRPYQLKIWKQLNQTFQNLDYIAGNSCKTVPDILSGQHEWKGPGFSTSLVHKHAIQCDILHGSSLCPTDNIDLVEHAPCGALLTSTAMGSLKDPAVYFGPNAQWRQLRQRGCITQPVCWQEEALQLDRNFVFAGQGSTHAHQFCMAMTTGKCRSKNSSRNDQEEASSCSTDLYEVVSKLALEQYCPQFQIAAPP